MRLRGQFHAHKGFVRAFPALEAIVGGFKSTDMPVAIANASEPDCPLVYVNEAFTRLTGYAATDAVGRNCRFLQGKETNAETVMQIREAIRARKSIAVDILNYRKDGSQFWNALSLAPICDDQGALCFYFACQFDAAERRSVVRNLEQRNIVLEGGLSTKAMALESTIGALNNALREKELLIHELHHRVRNNLQMISALIGMQIHDLNEGPEKWALARLRYRVNALSAVHRRLHNPASPATFDLAEFLLDHVPDVVSAYSDGHVSLSGKFETAVLKTELATPLALIFNEIVTGLLSAMPHDASGRRLSVELTVRDLWVHVAVFASHDNLSPGEAGLGYADATLLQSLVRQVHGTIAFPQSAGMIGAEVQIPAGAL